MNPDSATDDFPSLDDKLELLLERSQRSMGTELTRVHIEVLCEIAAELHSVVSAINDLEIAVLQTTHKAADAR